ncbi:MAG: tRNA guanosine(15) transglycosylase TgtA [Thermoplasmatota archaeon]
MSGGEDAQILFEVRDTDLAGRGGTLSIHGRKVETPELMPVVNPNLLLSDACVSPRELGSRFGFGMIITNSYIIRKGAELQERALKEGLHKLCGFDGMIMTDSGTFQSYIYGGRREREVEVDPMEIVSFQKSIGSDIGTILDKFTVPDKDHDGALRDLDTTLGRAALSREASGGMGLAVPVQGGRHPDLRELSGRSVRELGVEYAPIGGVVPIMESYDYRLLVDVIVSSKKGLGPSIPAHLFGAGHPMILPLAAALGCDLFDSASYAKFASDDRYMTEHRTFHLKELDVLPCSCPVCSGSSPEELKELPKARRVLELSRHNLWTLRKVLDSIRSAIREGTLWEMVERSAVFNPQLYSAVRRLREHSDFLEENAPRTTRRFMCSTGLSLARPEFSRYRQQIMNCYSPQSGSMSVAMTDWSRTHSRKVVERFVERRSRDLLPFVLTPLGPAPYDVIDMYPLSQMVVPEPGSLDGDLVDWMNQIEGAFLKGNKLETLTWDGEEEWSDPVELISENELSISKIHGIVDLQFGIGFSGSPFSSIIINPERIRVVRSRRTGKIRNVMEEGGSGEIHLLSLRAEDGHFNLRMEAARRLHNASDPPYRRVVVEEGTEEFNARGFNVFCKFVVGADPGIRPGDEVLIVDQVDRLHAVGRAAVSARHMAEGRYGIAVKVREGADKDAGESP